jgi:diguanylate cyclase (GGDEF)-like protein
MENFYKKMYNDLLVEHKQLQKELITDHLTGLYNRKHFDQTLENKVKIANKKQNAFSLMLFDIDLFKQYNDTYGHPEGDLCLKTVGNMSKKYFHKKDDRVYRYGGEEFAVILPGQYSDEVLWQMEDFRNEIQEMYNNGAPLKRPITISYGVSTKKPHEMTSPEILLRQADNALYRSKTTGRNKGTIDIARDVY